MRIHVLGAALFVVTVVVSHSHAQHTAETLDEVKKNIDDKKALIVDVREKSETDQGHVSIAALAPLSVLRAGAEKDDFKETLHAAIPKDRILYCYCRAGVRAVAGAEILRAYGYDARALKPGFDELSKSGFTVKKPKAD